MYTRFCACKTVKGACLCMWDIVPVNEQACTLLMITWYSSRKFTKLALKLLAAKAPSLFQSCVLLLSSKLYYFSLHDNHPPFLYSVIYLHSNASIFDKLKWEKQYSKCNILTMDHKRVPENFSSPAVNTMPNTIICLKVLKYLDIRLRHLLN